MLTFPDREAILAARNMPLPAELHCVLNQVVDHAAEADLLNLTYIVVVEQGDSEQAILDEVGFSPLTTPIEGYRYGDPRLYAFWAYLGEREGWFELIHPVGNDGFAYVLLIDSAADSELVRMCCAQRSEP